MPQTSMPSLLVPASHAGRNRPAVHIDLDVPARLLLAAQCGLPHMPGAVRQKVSSFLTYETMLVIAASIGIVISAHVVGAGFAADIVLGTVTVAVVGTEAVEAARHLTRFYALALAAKYRPDFEQAGREFASFVTIVGVNVALVLFTKVKLKKVRALKPVDSNLAATAWSAYIERLNLRVPRDQGILWSKVGAQEAERLARSKGLTSLEMLLKREGFLDVYSSQFGTFENVKAAGLQNVTARIWRDVSRRYAANLEGKVTAFIDQKQLGKALSKGDEPVLIDELWEIAEIMQANPKINSVQMIDVSSGKSWHLLREQVLKSTTRLH